jgi:hypothetical protein
MIWVVWQQHRHLALAGAVALAVIVAALLGLSTQMEHEFQSSGLAACVAAGDHDQSCAAASGDFAQHYTLLTLVVLLGLTVVPLLIGMFFGAPLLADELNAGTHRLAWTQGITRYRWLLVKLGLPLVAVLLAQTIVEATSWWWYRPLVEMFGGPFAGFDIEGVTPIAYALFAFLLGLTAGLLTRSTVMGMAITLIGFVVVRIVLALVARPYYLPPIPLSWDTRQLGPHVFHVGPSDPTEPFNWARGNGVDLSVAFNGDWRFGAALHGTTITELYQPASRFWTFQGIEAGIFVALAIILLGLTVWRIRRVS